MYKKKPFYFSSLLGDFCQGAFVLFPCNMFTEEDMDDADEWRYFYANFFKELSWDVVRTCCLVRFQMLEKILYSFCVDGTKTIKAHPNGRNIKI
jgi:hypothetical protein